MRAAAKLLRFPLTDMPAGFENFNRVLRVIRA